MTVIVENDDYMCDMCGGGSNCPCYDWEDDY